jgi:hypothetical protein
LGQEGDSLGGVVGSAKEDEAAELICRFAFFACSSADDDFFAQKAKPHHG